tara:strand:- start:12990 stop:13373 length:384 start_codon:yes stop_codon:yes gene_type:complete
MSNSKTFSFYDDFGDNDSVCNTTISIEEKISNNSPIYNINFVHSIEKNGRSNPVCSIEDVKKPCPFAYCSPSTKSSYEGVIVIRNDMTKQMVRFLMMDDEELAKHTGCTTPNHYRKLIMVQITKFWD